MSKRLIRFAIVASFIVSLALTAGCGGNTSTTTSSGTEGSGGTGGTTGGTTPPGDSTSAGTVSASAN